MTDDLVTHLLITRMTGGDSSAREELVGRYYRDILRFCAYRAGSVCDAACAVLSYYCEYSAFKLYELYTARYALNEDAAQILAKIFAAVTVS